MGKPFWTNEEVRELKTKFSQMTPVDIAEYFDGFTKEQRAIATTILDKSTMAEVFAEFSAEKKQELIMTLTQPEITALLLEIKSDDLVDAIQELPSNMVSKLIDNVEKDRREMINQLLKFPEKSVGSLMSVEYVGIHEDDTREEVIEKIRDSDAGYEHLTAVYVLEPTRKLIGYIYLADLIRSEEESIKDLINYDVISVKTMTDQEEAANSSNGLRKQISWNYYC